MNKLALIVMIVIMPILLAACQTAKTETAAPNKTALIDAEVNKAVFTDDGDLVTDIAAPGDQVLAAAKTAIDEAGFNVTDIQNTDNATDIATKPKNAPPDLQQSYKIKLEPKAGVTHITIRFGMYGHVSASQSMLGMILRELRK